MVDKNIFNAFGSNDPQVIQECEEYCSIPEWFVEHADKTAYSRDKDEHEWFYAKYQEYMEKDPDVGEFFLEMARRDQRKIGSHLVVLIQHLIKWIYQPRLQSDSWTNSIRNAQFYIQYEIEESGGLNHFVLNKLDVQKSYSRAKTQAINEMKANSYQTPPEECPWTIQQLIDSVWLTNIIEKYRKREDIPKRPSRHSE